MEGNALIVGQANAAQANVEDPGTLAQFRIAVWHVRSDMSQHVGEGTREGVGEHARTPPVAPPLVGPHRGPFCPKAAAEKSSIIRVRNIFLLVIIEIFWAVKFTQKTGQVKS